MVNFPINHDGLTATAALSLAGTLSASAAAKIHWLALNCCGLRATNLPPGASITRPQLTPLVERIGSSHLWVERTIDPALFELKNDPAAKNGHIPISAIFAAAGAVTAILSGRQQVIVSNESSASEPTLHYQDVAINHQYSKSLEFEQDFQAISEHLFGADGPHYFSLLRPFSEVRIAELFAGADFCQI